MQLVPDLVFDSIREITPEVVEREHVRGLVLDIDNTLAPKRTLLPDEYLVQWVESLQNAGVCLFVISNNYYDRVSRFAKELNLPFIHFGLKPLPFAFLRAVRRMGLPRNQVAAVGDQIFTDVVGAHSAGLKAWLVMPIDRNESLSFSLRRRMERPVIQKYYRTLKEEHK